MWNVCELASKIPQNSIFQEKPQPGMLLPGHPCVVTQNCWKFQSHDMDWIFPPIFCAIYNTLSTIHRSINRSELPHTPLSAIVSIFLTPPPFVINSPRSLTWRLQWPYDSNSQNNENHEHILWIVSYLFYSTAASKFLMILHFPPGALLISDQIDLNSIIN